MTSGLFPNTFGGVDYENRSFRLRSAGYHVFDKFDMPGRIDYYVLAFVGIEEYLRSVYRDALFAFFLQMVEQICKLRTAALAFTCLFDLGDLIGRKRPGIEKQPADQCRFAMVNMAHYYKI
jgi:hypothetical protein